MGLAAAMRKTVREHAKKSESKTLTAQIRALRHAQASTQKIFF